MLTVAVMLLVGGFFMLRFSPSLALVFVTADSCVFGCQNFYPERPTALRHEIRADDGFILHPH